MRILRIVAIWALCGAISTTDASVARLFKQQVCNETDLAVVGKVDSIYSYRQNGQTGIVVSDVTVAVERVVKGTAGGAVTVFVLGGVVDGDRYGVGGMPNFELGERYFFLLHNRSGQNPTIKLGGSGAVLLDPDAQLPPNSVLVGHWEEHCGS